MVWPGPRTMTLVVKGFRYDASAPTTVNLWLATVKKSGWFNAEFITRSSMVSPTFMGTIVVSVTKFDIIKKLIYLFGSFGVMLLFFP